ncbi:MAG: YaiI/YqxD family protein [Deltaproteobacteria bacterium]|nr:YaiI/YqxD family protein [Deltaproteobacteria bacterium]
MFHIFVDADACPVKAEVYRVAQRYNLAVTLVANAWMRVPSEPGITLKVVGGGLDAADDWIVEQVKAFDIVVTADILLADRCLKKGAMVIGSSGKLFTENNIGDAVATRALLADLRDAGEITGGPPPLLQRDRSRFLHQLDEIIQRLRREGNKKGQGCFYE